MRSQHYLTQAEPTAPSEEGECGQTLDDLPRDRNPRWGYIELGSEDGPDANAEPTRGSEAPAKAEPAAVSGEGGCGQNLDDLPRDRVRGASTILAGRNFMSGKLAGLQRRADKIEQELAERAEKARQAWLAKCNCRPWTVVGSAEELEKELNLRCPNHGFRRLGKVVDVNSFNRGEPPRWLDEMLATYNANLEQAEREPAPEPPDF